MADITTTTSTEELGGEMKASSFIYGICFGIVACVLILAISPCKTEQLLIRVRTDFTPKFTHVNNYNWHGEIQVFEYTTYYYKVFPYEDKWQEAKFDGWRPEGDLKVYSVRNIFDRHLFYRYELLRPDGAVLKLPRKN